MRKLFRVVALFGLLPAAAWSQVPRSSEPRPSDLCVRAIALVEPGTRIPPNLLSAIGRVESGRMDSRDGAAKAWPWTINAEGRGSLYESKAEAIAAVVALRARGVASVDVGCMQVNLMHHPTAFATLDEAFDPLTNVRYAARFLGELHAQTADWNMATAFYHSRTPDLAQAYQRKVAMQLPGAALIRVALKSHDDMADAWASTLASSGGPSAGSAVQGTFRTSAGSRAPLSRRTRMAMLVSQR